MVKSVFTKCHQALIRELKTEGKWTGHFENLNRPPDDLAHGKSTTIITTNIISATTNTTAPAAHSIMIISTLHPWNASTRKTQEPPSEIKYFVDIAWSGEPRDVRFYLRTPYQVQISLDNQENALQNSVMPISPSCLDNGTARLNQLPTLNCALPPNKLGTSTVSDRCL